MDRHRPEDRIIVPYEHLVDEFQGPLVATELNEFLGQGPGVSNGSFFHLLSIIYYFLNKLKFFLKLIISPPSSS